MMNPAGRRETGLSATMKAKGHQQRQTKRIAAERIGHLFETAERFYATDPARSDRCVAVARAIAMRQRLRLEREQRRAFCHACHAYLRFGANARVRVRDGHVTVSLPRLRQPDALWIGTA